MIVCKNCGSSIDDNAKFCTTCGQTISAEMPSMNINGETNENIVPTVENEQPLYQQNDYQPPVYKQEASSQQNYQQGYGQNYQQNNYNQRPYQQNTYEQGYGQNNYNQQGYGQPNQQPPYNPNQPIYNMPANNYVQPKRTNGFAIAGFVLALVSLVVCCVYYLALPGVIFSAIGLKMASKNRGGKGLAIAGLIISILVLVGWTSIIILNGGCVTSMDSLENFIEGLEGSTSYYY